MCSFLDDLHTGSDLPTSPGSLKGKGAFSFLFFISLFPIFLISIFLLSTFLFPVFCVSHWFLTVDF